ncbi:hypothetical protein BG000_008341 [Podila horticola]|nr:hypothetical protein BG000_008341 [Podila horticola]
MPPALNTLPLEVLALVLSFLPQNSLAQYASVNRTWSSICCPLLWRTVKITNRQAFHRFLSVETQAALAKHAHLIRHLHAIYFPVIQSIADCRSPCSSNNPNNEPTYLCRNLESLDIGQLWHTPDEPSESYPRGRTVPALTEDQERLMIRLIRNNPWLRILHVGHYLHFRNLLLTSLTDEHFPALQELVLFDSNRGSIHYFEIPSPNVLKRFLENCPRSLRKLQLSFCYREELVGQIVWDNNDGGPTECLPHPHIERVQIGGELDIPDSDIDRLLMPFFNSCTNSRASLHVQWFPYQSRCLVQSLPRVVEGFLVAPGKVLNLSSVGRLASTELVERLRTEQDWTTIDLEDWSESDDSPGEDAGTAILERCKHLKILNIVRSAALFMILCRSTQLTHLIASTNAGGDNLLHNPRLLAQDIIHGSWACRDLKELAVEITGVPRPDITIGHNGWPVVEPIFRGSIAESYDIQRSIYQQLAQLKNLEKLQLEHIADDVNDIDYWALDVNIRYRYVDPKFQLTCLEMSLASGLHLLAGLKELRELNGCEIGCNTMIPCGRRNFEVPRLTAMALVQAIMLN